MNLDTRPRLTRCLALSFCLWAIGLAAARAAETPSVDELLAYLHIDKSERENLLRGKILSTEVTEGSEKELAVGVVMFVPAPMDKLVEFVRSGKVFTTDREVIGFGELKETADVKDLSGIAFTPEQTKEAAGLLEIGPGLRFNLATDEIQAFRALKSVARERSAIPAAVAQVYQQLLWRRYQAYREGGLTAIAPYDRGGGRVSRPGEELLGALKESTLMADHFPWIHQALREFPRQQPKDAVHRFFWVNQKVENRPTFTLTHRMSVVRPEGAFMAERQYYVAHSYNSSFLLAGCLPLAGGTVVLYSNHTSTDQVMGLGGGLRHSIGRGQMREEVVKSFERIRASLSSP